MSLTCTAAVANMDVPAVTISVSSSPSVTDLLTVWRIHEDESLHQVLTSAHSTLIGTWTGIDYHCPFDQNVTYFAQSGGLSSASSAQVWLPSNGEVWLIHPSDPSLSFLVEKWYRQESPYKYAGRAQKSLVLNSKLPRSRSGSPRAGESGTLMIKVSTPAVVKNLFADGGQVLINTPFDDDEIGWKWIQPDDLEVDNPATHSFPYRYAKFAYEQVQQPDADVHIWTIAEFMAAWPTGGVPGADPDTIGNANSHYANLTAVKLDVRS